MRIRRPCSHIGCHTLTTNTYCDAHAVQHAVQQQQRVQQSNRECNARRPKYNNLYSTKEWARLRFSQLAQHPWCAECLRYGVRKVAEEADHIIPHRGDRVLFYDSNNIQSLCSSCHSRKTAKEKASPHHIYY